MTWDVDSRDLSPCDDCGTLAEPDACAECERCHSVMCRACMPDATCADCTEVVREAREDRALREEMDRWPNTH